MPALLILNAGIKPLGEPQTPPPILSSGHPFSTAPWPDPAAACPIPQSPDTPHQIARSNHPWPSLPHCHAHAKPYTIPANPQTYRKPAKMTPSSKRLPSTRAAQFGPEYEQLLLTIWKKTPFRFPLATNAAARAMRAKVYGYFRFQREENLRLDLIEMADSLTLRLEDNVLELLRNEETWDHESIRSILGLTKDSYGLAPAPGNELEQPDLLGTRLTKQLAKLRDRQDGSPRIVPPTKL